MKKQKFKGQTMPASLKEKFGPIWKKKFFLVRLFDRCMVFFPFSTYMHIPVRKKGSINVNKFYDANDSFYASNTHTYTNIG